jgi:hypothetical protein
MPPPFKFQVPADAAFRPLSIDLARKYAELAGASAGDAGEFATAIEGVADRMAAAAPPGSAIDLEFTTTGQELDVAVRCAGAETTITHTLSAPRR